MGTVGKQVRGAKRSRPAADGGCMRVFGLFAGVGGLEAGLEAAGHRTVRLCEIDDDAVRVLMAHFPGVPVDRDVAKIESMPREVDLLTAGFPCQNLSPAGDTTGIRGAKSSLVRHVFGLLRDRQVPWVVLENVPFMLQLERGRAMRHVVEELEELGYRWAYRVVDAMAFGLPQRRRRVFVVASRQGDPERVLFADEAKPRAVKEWTPKVPAGFYWTEGNRGVGWAVGAIPTLKGGSGLGIPSAPAVLMPRGDVLTPDIEGAERLQGFPAGWTAAGANAKHGRHRWRMVGNAVNVRAAEWLGSHLRDPGTFDAGRLGEVLRPGSSWPVAARGRDGERRAVRIGEWPECRPCEPIGGFLANGKLLSVRATEGFVRRAERAEREGHLSFPDGFLDGLRAHLDRMRGLARAAI